MSIDEMVIAHAITCIRDGWSKMEIMSDIAQNTNLRKTTIYNLVEIAYERAGVKV